MSEELKNNNAQQPEENLSEQRQIRREKLQALRDAPRAEGAERIYTHGEKEVAAAADRRENGIPVNDGTMIELQDLCSYLKLDFASYFPGYEPPTDFAGFAGNY